LDKESLLKFQAAQRHLAGHPITPKTKGCGSIVPTTPTMFSPESDFVVTHNLSARRRRHLSTELKKAGKGILAPRDKAEEFRKSIADRVKWKVVAGPEDVPKQENKSGLICSNIKEVLEWRVVTLIESSQIDTKYNF
jgi:hypothetical protein